MKGIKLLLGILVFFALGILTSFAQNESAIDESNLILDLGVGNQYYNLFNSGNPNFQGTNFGNFNCDDTFLINGAQQLTHKCGDHNISYSELNYRIYQGATPPAFTPVEILYNSDLGTFNYCSSSSNDQNWQTDGAGINILSGLAPGTYNFEVYTVSNFESIADGNGTHFISNFGPNFFATFTVIDTVAPVITLTGADPQILESCAAYVELGATIADCETGLTVTIDDSAVDMNTAGNYNVTYNVTDTAGNPATQVIRVVTVQDTTAPIPNITNLPNISDQCSVTLSAPTANDCNGTITATTLQPTTYSTQGTYIVTWTYDDGYGNTSTQNQNVIIDDITAPVADTATLSDITADCEVTSLTAPTATDNCGGIVTVTNNATLPISGEGTTTVVTWTYDDGNGNTSTQTQNVIIDDVTNPIAVCQDITVQLDPSGTINISPLDIDNGSSDNCGIQTLSVNPSSFDCSNIGTNTITLTVTDINGNSSTCTSTVTVEDNTPPTTNVGECGSLEITIDAISGQAVISQAQVNALYTGSDACGIQNITLAKTTFECNEPGDQDVQLTIEDVNGNLSYCTVVITVNAPIITSGTLTGLVVNPPPTPVVPADDLIEVTACPGGVAVPKDVLLTLNLDASSTILPSSITTWQISINNGVSWTDVAGTAGLVQYTLTGLLTTTLVRVEIQSGICFEYSPLAVIRFLPPDAEPIITSITDPNICLNESVTVVAESFFESEGQFEGGGDFNDANPEGWAVDGIEDDLNGSGNNTNTNRWKETNGPSVFGNLRYDTSDNTKFAIANGPRLTTLETPIFNTIGMTPGEAILQFYQAYYFCSGATGRIELSLDGGATYTVVLTTVQNDNYVGPNDSGFAWNGSNCGNGPNGRRVTSEPLQFASIDLSAYVGMANLRIQFTYDAVGVSSCTDNFPVDPSYSCTVGNTNQSVVSSWVVDDVGFPYTAIDEELEWTDENGVVVATGTTVNVTPITPGVQIYGVTTLVNGCRAIDVDGSGLGTTDIIINTSLAYAGQNFVPTASNCGQSSINLKAYDNTITAVQNFDLGAHEAGLYVVPNTASGDNDYLGTGVLGAWTIEGVSGGGCGTSATFSSNSNPRALFTADPGTYSLRWTLANGCFDDVEITINSCNDIDFDGINDFASLRDNYALDSSFSIENWVKPQSVSGVNSVFSKKNASDNTRGYTLNIENGIVRFHWFNAAGNGTIESQFPINTDRWYHLAVTFNGSVYSLFIDGIDVGTVSGSINPPIATTSDVEALIGALDNDNESNNDVVSFYHGWIDELRIWNTALTPAQIHQMMNQEIEDNVAVRGVVVPLDIAGLSWANLDGYYKMNVNCGYLSADKGNRGRLRNMSSSQQETAPLPYTSRVDGQDWATDNTWTNFNVWDAPNSIGVDGVTPIDWNIVQISHDINSGDKDITVLGLISDTVNKELTIMDPLTSNDEANDGQMLRVTHYLDLDGNIDLVGESQLVQDENSILDNNSAGKLERDQQGTTNLFNYNYWSSPVTAQGASNNSPYTVNGVLRDGTDTNAVILPTINWIGGYDASPSPLSIPSYWLYSYEDFPEDSYSLWNPIGQSGSLNAGLAFTMKGSGASTSFQNYVFVGKPNNGTITNSVSISNQVLAGNPYPSAIDAIEFIKDNIPVGGNPGSSGSIDGTLYFWEHYTSNASHILQEYEGGYATYNLTGPNQAPSSPLISGLGTPSKIPAQYIPIAQGFFVTASSTGGNITFNNDQRVFEKETSGNSQFFRNPNSQTNTYNEPDPQVKRLRFDYEGADGYHRYLLLGFIDNPFATDGCDYGYDAEISELLANDLSFEIDGKNCSTQGVGAFDDSKQYPLSLFSNMSGTVKLSLTDIENFEVTPSVYVFDSLLNTYTALNENDFELVIAEGEHIDRFYIVFMDNSALSTNDFTRNEFDILYLTDSKELFIYATNIYDIKTVKLFNITGQEVRSYNNVDFIYNNSELSITIPSPDISEGVYIVKCLTTKNSINKKFIIKK